MNCRWALHIVWGIVLAISWSCEKEKISNPPLIYGHAGTALSDERAVFPPNSEASIFYALDVLNAHGVEVDVQMTKDSILVLYHDEFLDPELDENTVGAECVSNLTWTEIQASSHNDEHQINKLSDIIGQVVGRGKLIYLDIKYYNFCSAEIIDLSAFNWALNNILSPFSDIEKQRITVNCRNIDLLNSISDTVVIKSFETEKIALGIDFVELYGIDKLTTKLSQFDQEKAVLLKNAEVPYSFYEIKTKQDIKRAATFNPSEVISDNIAGTRKFYY